MGAPSMDVLHWLRQERESADGDLLREMVRAMAEVLMSAEVSERCQAGSGERTPQRQNARNGYRTRRWDTRVGTIDLAIPKLRQGSYFPAWLVEPRRRAERALVAVVAAAYLQGVSTRRVDDLVQTLGIAGISQSQVAELAQTRDATVRAFRDRPLEAGPYRSVWCDARTQRCREGGRIGNLATVIATGVNADGHREVLGGDVVTSEDGVGGTAFLRSLVARGLSGVPLAISDAHPASRTPSPPSCPVPAGSAGARRLPATCSPACPKPPRTWWGRACARSLPRPRPRPLGPSPPASSASAPPASRPRPTC